MELFDLSHLHQLVSYLHDHPSIGGLITFGIAFVESLALIGGLIPGSVTMTAIGALIGSGAMPMLITILWAIAGAFAGDFLSYAIGAYYNERLKSMWPFRKHPQWLGMGQDFFGKHGGKSVVIGRFFGPVRSLVPLVAGLMHMSILRFMLSAALAAVLWSVVYIIPGIIVGALSLELPPATATKFILIVLAIVAFGWIVFVLIHLFFKNLVSWADRAMSSLWQYLEQHRATHWLTRLLSASNQPNQHRQLTLALFIVLCLGLFGWVFCSMLTQGTLSHLNQPTFELLRSLRTRVGDDILLAATLLGYKYTQLSAGLLIFLWLVWKRDGWAALHWLGVMLLTVTAIGGVKTLYYSPRPIGLLHPQLTSSFPSGHVALSAALFGFLAMLLAHHLPADRRKTPLLVGGFFVLAIALSRVYLGAHWLTDVLASLFLGLSCAALVNLSYLRRPSKPLPVAQLSGVSVGIFLLVGLIYGGSHFRAQQEDYTLYWPTVTMDTNTWWHRPQDQVPLFILSRLGKPDIALNVQWLGSLENIRQQLIAQGWQEHPVHLNWKGSLNRLSAKANPEHLPVWPWLYQNHPPALMMTKSQTKEPPLYFVLWQSNVSVADSAQKLWVGSVHYFIPHVHKDAASLSMAQTHRLYAQALRIFIAGMHEANWRVWHITTDEQPPIMGPLNWDGKLILIKDVQSTHQRETP